MERKKESQMADKEHEAIKKFDAVYRQANEEMFVTKRFGAYVIYAISFIFMCIPVEYALGFKLSRVYVVLLLVALNIGFSVSVQLYTTYKDQKEKTKSVYEITKYCPIKATTILKSRLQYLMKHIVVFSLLSFFGQLTFSILYRQFSSLTILYVMGILGISAFIQGVGQLFLYMFRDK